MLNWLLQGLVSNWISAVIMLAVGALVTYLKKKSSAWLGPTMWGLGGCVLAGLVLICFWGVSSIPKNRPPDVTTDNIEKNVRTWLDDFGLSTKKEDDPATYFKLTATMPSGDPVTIARLKTHDSYVAVEALISISPEHKTVLDKLSPQEMTDFFNQLNMELARAKIGNIIQLPTQITVVSRIPITSSLTEDEFVRCVDEVEFDIIIVRSMIQLKVASMAKTEKK